MLVSLSRFLLKLMKFVPDDVLSTRCIFLCRIVAAPFFRSGGPRGRPLLALRCVVWPLMQNTHTVSWPAGPAAIGSLLCSMVNHAKYSHCFVACGAGRSWFSVLQHGQSSKILTLLRGPTGLKLALFRAFAHPGACCIGVSMARQGRNWTVSYICPPPRWLQGLLHSYYGTSI